MTDFFESSFIVHFFGHVFTKFAARSIHPANWSSSSMPSGSTSVLGRMSLGGNIIPVESLAESLQVAVGARAKRILLPMASVKDIPTIPGELFAKFQTGFYADPVFNALGVQ